MDINKSLIELPGSETFNIIDSTKIKCFKDCPRKFFYNFILHWRRDEPNIHLEFGTAWHLAKEHLFNTGFSKENVDEAFAIFLSHFRKFYDESDELNLAPKNSGNAYKALQEYARQFGAINSRMSVLATEIAGKVQLNETFQVSFKIDAVLEDSVGIWVLDHKTSSRDGQLYDDSWFLSEQMNVYTHALHCLYDPAKVQGAYVDLSILRKTGNLHKRLPVKKSFTHLEEWHADLVRWFEILQQEYRRLESCSPSDKVMAAFPKNTESCTKYGRCPYMSICLTPCNPMSNPTNPPGGFRREVWNPHCGDKSWRPKFIFSQSTESDSATLRPPTDTELSAYEAARTEFEHIQKKSELDDFNFQGFI